MSDEMDEIQSHSSDGQQGLFSQQAIKSFHFVKEILFEDGRCEVDEAGLMRLLMSVDARKPSQR